MHSETSSDNDSEVSVFKINSPLTEMCELRKLRSNKKIKINRERVVITLYSCGFNRGSSVIAFD